MPREPWIKVKIGTRRSGKLAGLPNDSARLGYFYLLLEAKVQRHLGAFDNRAHFVEVLGRFGRFFEAYVEAGLLHVAPALCDECKSRHRDAKRGQVVVHDYRREQRDATNADRQAAYRDRHADEDDVTGSVTPDVTPDVTPAVTADPPTTVTADSRARATTATATTTEPLLGVEVEPQRGSSSRGSSRERPDVAALHERGWAKVTRPQRKVLDEIAARHDVTGHEFAAEAIRNAPPDADPLEAAMQADALWQQHQRAQANGAEADWLATKAQERDDAAKTVDRLPWLVDAVVK